MLGGSRRRDRGLRRRTAGVPAHRRSDRRGSGARHLRHLGHAVAGPVRFGKYGATGPFAADNSAPLKGLFYGGGTQVLVAQIIGSAIITIATFVVALVVMYAVNAMGLLRVSAEGEN